MTNKESLAKTIKKVEGIFNADTFVLTSIIEFNSIIENANRIVEKEEIEFGDLVGLSSSVNGFMQVNCTALTPSDIRTLATLNNQLLMMIIDWAKSNA